jgi:hypothetical protein
MHLLPGSQNLATKKVQYCNMFGCILAVDAVARSLTGAP